MKNQGIIFEESEIQEKIIFYQNSDGTKLNVWVIWMSKKLNWFNSQTFVDLKYRESIKFGVCDNATANF